MFGLLLILFTVVPAIEIYLLIKVGSQLGGLNTISIVLLTGIIGASLAKSQGLSILQRIQKDLSQGSLPADQFIHGLFVFGGGLLLLTPGFLTDLLGLSMVFPGTRHLLVQFFKHKIQSGINNGNIFFSTNFTKNNSFYSNEEFHQHENETFYDKKNNVIEVDFTEKKTND